MGSVLEYYELYHTIGETYNMLIINLTTNRHVILSVGIIMDSISKKEVLNNEVG